MLTGDIPNPSKCFSLIRKAKSARIRQDLLEKSRFNSFAFISNQFFISQVLKHQKRKKHQNMQRSLDLDDRSMIMVNQIFIRSLSWNNFSLASIYSSPSSTPKPSNVGFLKSNPLSTTSGIIGTSRLHNRREGNVKVNQSLTLHSNKIHIFIPFSFSHSKKNKR